MLEIIVYYVTNYKKWGLIDEWVMLEYDQKECSKTHEKIKLLFRWLRLSRQALWSLLDNSGLDGRGLSVCFNPDCRCRLLPKSRRLPFSGFLPLDVSSPDVGDIFRSGRCRCGRCSGSQRRRDFGRRRHRQSGLQHIHRPRPSSP